ncbi:MAG: 2-oxopent-4-enoate hydratase [Deltaproteobacteria bacterium]|nr:2-oxopent-4-enoate hydratase [Deltaproteobacteria bacterium]
MSATVDARIAKVADALWQAERTQTAIDRPSDDGLVSVDDAYAVQQHNVARRLAAGERLVGRKIGITSKAVMEWLGVDQPDFGALLHSMAVDDGAACPVSTLIAPRVEGEVAFVLSRDLASPHVTAVDVVDATAWIAASIEIIDSRVKDWKIKLADTIADNASSARFVVSSTQASLQGLDLPLVGCALRKNGRVASSGAGAACLGNPVNAVVWLARTLAARGTPLRAGDLVLSGALCPVVPVAAGDVIDLDVGGVGRCSVRFG